MYFWWSFLSLIVAFLILTIVLRVSGHKPAAKETGFFFWLLLVLGVLSVPSAVFANALRSLINDYRFKFSEIPDDFLKSFFLERDTYIDFVSIIDPPNFIFWLFFAILLLTIIASRYNLLRSRSSFDQVHEYGSHGTARWSSESEIRSRHYKNDIGWFLGTLTRNTGYQLGMKAAYHAVENDVKLNMQINIVGPPGSNKTTGFNLPNLLHIPQAYRKAGMVPPDVIVTDPKSELYSLTSEHYRKLGYDVRVLDFIHFKHGDSLNPLTFVSDDKELMEIAKGYIKAVNTEDGARISGDGKFWMDESSQVLCALLGFVVQKLPFERRTLTEVAKLLTSDLIADLFNAQYLFDLSEITGAPLQLWKNFLMVAPSERTRANILGTLANDLRMFSIPGVQNITGTSTFDIRQIGAKKDRPMILYILMPDGDRTFSPIINTIVTTILFTLYKTAYHYGNSLYTPVYLLLEEIANIGYIPGLLEKLGTMRGRKIYPAMSWQDLSQIRAIYGDAWESVVAKCDTHLYFGVNDKFSADYVSDIVGKTTIQIQGMSHQQAALFVANKSESLNYQSRSLLLPDEVRRFNNERLIVYQRGLTPSQLYKTQYKYWNNQIVQSCSLDTLCVLYDYAASEISSSDLTNQCYQIIRSKLDDLFFAMFPKKKRFRTTDIGNIPFKLEAENEVENSLDIEDEDTPVEDLENQADFNQFFS